MNRQGEGSDKQKLTTGFSCKSQYFHTYSDNNKLFIIL